MTDATWLDKQIGVHAPIWSKTMRLLLTTIILTLLAQPVWAEDQLDQNEIREIIATITNEGVASALASCLTQKKRRQ